MIRERLRGRLEAWLLRVWFDTPGAPAGAGDRVLAAMVAPIALPLSWIVATVARRRRARIRRQAPGGEDVPVVVVGNLVVGGAGKTPLTVAIARGLREHGFRPGLLAGGYRGSAAGDGALLVDHDSDAARVGDEAVLLAQQTGLPVAAGRNRAAGLELLKRHHPDCDVIVSDDGLQHRGLARRIELVAIDDRGLGNGRCLPAGPLREPADRLASVDALILVSTLTLPVVARTDPSPLCVTADVLSAAPRRFRSAVQPTRFWSLDGNQAWAPADFGRRFGDEPLSALAGIARPQRFFDLLASLGLRPQRHPLPDHGRIDPEWAATLPGRWLLMTSKDAVKCRNFNQSLLARCVCLEVAAVLEPALLKWLVFELRKGAHLNG